MNQYEVIQITADIALPERLAARWSCIKTRCGLTDGELLGEILLIVLADRLDDEAEIGTDSLAAWVSDGIASTRETLQRAAMLIANSEKTHADVRTCARLIRDAIVRNSDIGSTEGDGA